MAFLLVGAKALVTVPEVEVATFFVGEDGSVDGPHEVIKAGFNLWPYGTRGSYTTDLSFDKTGLWKLEIVGQEEGADRRAVMEVEVTDGFEVVDVGQKAPASMNRTVGDGAPLEGVCPPPTRQTRNCTPPESPTHWSRAAPRWSYSPRRPSAPRPLADPRWRRSARSAASTRGRPVFIHVEVYENPHEVQGDLTRARTSPIMDEWGPDQRAGVDQRIVGVSGGWRRSGDGEVRGLHPPPTSWRRRWRICCPLVRAGRNSLS